MKRGIITAIIFVLLCSIAFAQINKDTTTIRCGDGVLDDFEMCEKGIKGIDKCDGLVEILNVDVDCRTEVCACLPFVNSGFCGNDRREGVEMCDGAGEDLCSTFGDEIGVNLTCDIDCYCKIVGGVPASYYPGYNETEEEPEGMAVCGDKELQLKEECDPPNSLCTLEDNSVGVCAEGCKCKPKESIGISEKEDEEIDEVEDSEEEEEVEEIKEKDSKEGPGFFASIWAWVRDLFS